MANTITKAFDYDCDEQWWKAPYEEASACFRVVAAVRSVLGEKTAMAQLDKLVYQAVVSGKLGVNSSIQNHIADSIIEIARRAARILEAAEWFHSRNHDVPHINRLRALVAKPEAGMKIPAIVRGAKSMRRADGTVAEVEFDWEKLDKLAALGSKYSDYDDPD